MKAKHWRLAAALGIAALAPRGPASAETFSGEAFLRLDDHGQVVVVLDSAPADGRTDHVFVFAPETPIAGAFESRTIPVSIAYEATENQARLTVHGVSSPLFFQLAVNGSGVEDYVSLTRDGAIIVKQGLGLARRSRPERGDPLWDVLPSQFDTDATVVADAAGASPFAAAPDVITCGPNGEVTNDTDCTKGGVGSTTCSAGCPMGIWRGEEGSVTCKDGHYACCYCFLGVSIAKCRPNKCPSLTGGPIPVQRF